VTVGKLFYPYRGEEFRRAFEIMMQIWLEKDDTLHFDRMPTKL
jgi:hypothetical protein